MKIHLLRHCQAWRRSCWGAADDLRPLSRAGRSQADELVEHFAKERIDRMLSSPAQRCRMSIAPLAAARQLHAEIDPRLSEGESTDKVIELLLSLGQSHSVVCTQGDVIPQLLGELELRGLEIKGRVQCEKGSLWTLEGSCLETARASYTPPIRTRPRSENEALRLAILDLGSTSFHLLIAEATASGRIRRISRDRVMLELGAGLSQLPLPPELLERAVRAARRLASRARKSGAASVLAVATAAFRDAAEGAELAASIEQATGALVRILEGEEEARLILAAIRRRCDLPEGVNLGLDLGGGSLELALGDSASVQWEATLPLGAARLQQECIHTDPPTEAERARLCGRVREALAPHVERIRQSKPKVCAATGGSVRALARLVARRRGLPPDSPIHQMELHRAEISALGRELAGSSRERRLGMRGMQPERVDLLPAAALVLASLLAELDLGGLLVCDWGLREGVILEAMALASSGAFRR